MMLPGQVTQGALFYEFSREDQEAKGHRLRSIDQFIDQSGIWRITVHLSIPDC